MDSALPIKQALLAALLGAALAPLAAATLLARQDSASGSLFEALQVICFGHRSSDGGHTQRTPGLYMPMFSTPPKGGPIYNGPPLDDC